jgi:hypothetical protein
MAGAHREHQRLGVQQLEAQPAHQARVAHAAHHQVELAGAQLVEQRGVGGALHHDLHLRPALAQPRQRHRQQGRRHARQGADAQPLDAPARGRRHGLRAGVQRLEHAQRMRQQLLAGRREPLHAAPARVAALDQPRADDGLQLRQRLGHRGLAQRQPLGGAREVALLRHGHEGAQVAQLHVAQEILAKFERVFNYFT